MPSHFVGALVPALLIPAVLVGAVAPAAANEHAIATSAPPTGDEPAMCEGPCTQATSPSRNDVSLYFHAGVHWGR